MKQLYFDKIKRIVFFGCSLTSGHEIIDHELLGITLEECNDIKQKYEMKEFYNNYLRSKTGLTDDEYNMLTRERSYTAKLAKKLSLEHLSYASPGRSTDHVLLDLFEAFHSGELNPETDLIFLGMISPVRYLKFNSEGIPISRIMNNVDDQLILTDWYYNGFKLMQAYYSALECFRSFCDSNSFQYLIQPLQDLASIGAIDNPFFYDVPTDWRYIPTFDSMFKNIIKHAVDPTFSLTFGYVADRPYFCGYKHPPEIAHTCFAEDLYKKISERIVTSSEKNDE